MAYSGAYATFIPATACAMLMKMSRVSLDMLDAAVSKSVAVVIIYIYIYIVV